MAVESATYVNQLNETLPTNTDPISEGDNHLRLIKQVLKNTFPNISGAVTVTESDINSVTSRATKVSGAVAGNFASLDASGDLQDSGKAASDFIPVTEKAAANGVATLDSNQEVVQMPAGASSTAAGNMLYADGSWKNELVGIGQSWQDVASSRGWATWYTNSTSKPIQISISVSCTTDLTWEGVTLSVSPDGGTTVIDVGKFTTYNQVVAQLTAIIPPSYSYRITRGNGTEGINSWTELR